VWSGHIPPWFRITLTLVVARALGHPPCLCCSFFHVAPIRAVFPATDLPRSFFRDGLICLFWTKITSASRLHANEQSFAVSLRQRKAQPGFVTVEHVLLYCGQHVVFRESLCGPPRIHQRRQREGASSVSLKPRRPSVMVAPETHNLTRNPLASISVATG